MVDKNDGDGRSELWELKQQLNALIEQAHDGIYIADATGNPVSVNQACATIMGLPREKLLKTHPVELAQKGYIPEPVVPQVVEKRDKVTRVITYNSGREAIISCVPIFSQDGEITRIVCYLRDLGSPRVAQREVKLFKPLGEDYSRQVEEMLSQDDKISLNGGVFRSPQMSEVLNRALKAARIDSNVLITGETGVGKELIGRLIHQNSPRRAEGDFVKVDCAAIPEQLLESELFGYEKGAFTDARREGKAGRIELADKGTLFLDEIGELPSSLQSKLLNTLQDRKVMRIGGLQAKEVDFRLIAATNRNLEEMVEMGRFRQDLFYRLNVIRVHIPPLRERKDDILALIAFFLKQFNERYKLNKTISAEVLEHLVDYSWPGNVRELANVVEQLVVMSQQDVVTVVDLLEIKTFHKNPTGDNLNSGSKKLKEAVEEYESKLIQDAISKGGTLKEAAGRLGIDLSTLVRKMRKLKIKPMKSANKSRGIHLV